MDGREEARLIQQHWVYAGHEALSGVVTPGQVPPNHVVGHWEEATIWTLGALDARLFADASHPFVRAGGGVAGLPGFAALESSRIRVLSSRGKANGIARFLLPARTCD